VRIKLSGDGYGSPSVSSIRAHFPRESYLAYLPAIYSADDESRRFLERFLSIFQTDWDKLERQIEEVAAYFDPKAVPAGPFLDYLASWLALPLEGRWDDKQRRRLLEAAPGLYRRRGAVEGLRGYLRVYLQNINGLSAEEQLGFPQIIEGFRERQRFALSVEHSAELGHGAPLWSRSVVGRLQLGVFSREGEARLVSTGDPQRDVFHQFAHRFRVFVPAAWVRTADDEQMLRRAIELEKPAHTSYELFLVEPRFQVGIQSTVGVDTIVGAHSAMSLAGDESAAQQLGFNTVLGRHPNDPATLRLAPGARVGVDTVLN
jgi:phage tail-like protein